MNKAKNKNSIKLKLIHSANEGDNLLPQWALISKKILTEEEKKEIRNLVGNVVFQDEYEDVAFNAGESARDNGLTQYGTTDGFDSEDVSKDCYFPDDGYDYEKHLKSINKSRVYEHSARVPSIECSTSIIYKFQDPTKNEHVAFELSELMNCFEEPDNFEDINDDFVLDAAGLENKSELDKSIDIERALWGFDELQLGNSFGQCNTEFKLNKLSERCNKDTSISSPISTKNYNSYPDNSFDSILDEYNTNYNVSETSTNNKNPEVESDRNIDSSKELGIINYEHILDKYIKSAKSDSLRCKESERNVEISVPLNNSQIEKIFSILENAELEDEIADNSSIENSDSESDNMEQTIQISKTGVLNVPNKINVLDSYSNTSNSRGDGERSSLCLNGSDIKNKLRYKCEYNSSVSTPISYIPETRKKNETPEEKRERKHLIKQARREMREIKKKNKQDTKDIRKSLIGSFVNTNHHDLKSGVRYFRF
ncbi:ribosomal protein L13 [Cryptosporidium felis]|nr:ribosomal protein L13 [Cryptosporidium felis]